MENDKDTNPPSQSNTPQSQPPSSQPAPLSSPPPEVDLNVNMDTLSDEKFIRYFEELTVNIMSMRREALTKLLDPRRDLGDECGYPKYISAEQYQEMYERDPIGKRVCEAMVEESWVVSPEIYEDEDVETVKPFEQAWKDLSKQPLRGEPSWFQDEKGCIILDYLRRGSLQARIGHYSVLLIGLDDGANLRDPVKGIIETNSASSHIYRDGEGKVEKVEVESVEGIYGLTINATETKGRKLLFLRVFPEYLAVISQFEVNPSSPRFGQPTMYSITFNDPREAPNTGIGLNMVTYDVHWTRVVHYVGPLASSEIFSVPEMKAPFNRLMDLQKLYGGSAEMFWKGAFFGLSLESNPALGPNPVIDLDKSKNQMEKYFNGLQRYLALVGMTAKVLAPQVADPTNHINIQLEAITIEKGMPMRIFKGSERGELSSEQDAVKWDRRVEKNQNNHETTHIIVPTVDRFIMLGVLPTPKGYSVFWPSIDSRSAKEKAEIIYIHTQALALYTTSGAEAVMSLQDYYVNIWGKTEEEAKMLVENAREAMVETQELEDERQMDLIDKGLKLDPTEPPPGKFPPTGKFPPNGTGGKPATPPAKPVKK